jgi:RNA polymerase sigma-70 factor (ECF subfamily)
VSDAALVQRVISGDPDAARDFIRALGPQIYKTLGYLRVTGADRDDLFQDVFIHLFKDGYANLRQWHGDSSLKTFVSVVTHNVVRDWWRSQERERKRQADCDDRDPSEGDRIGSIPDPAPSPEELMLGQQLRQAIDRCLQHLCARDREVIGLRHLHGQSYKVIAALLGVTINNVGVLLLRAERQLRKCLSELLPDIVSPTAA